ncbi:LysR family transcriptional regulator [Nonomuraea typhae]|uniref:LysR family transcriptional regulator n=1 Tax=Nonomuraea typhae TaxID=2603600 RepID=UPI0012FC4074|nr:LysR family transcriptional regulator [Nonomuraea typhae]
MELRDIEIFLTLADELHFGRTAERLHVSPARVSQAIKKQERGIGAELFHRDSRNVRLTLAGEQLRKDLAPIYQGLKDSMERARLAAQGKTGVLRIGTISVNNYELRRYWETFRTRHPQWGLRLGIAPWIDPFDGLRRGEMDMLLTWLPVLEPDLIVGPTMFTDGRVLTLAVDHELAGRTRATIEMLGDFPLPLAKSAPDYWLEAYTPRQTPEGNRIEPGLVVASNDELYSFLGMGEIINASPAHVARYFARPDLVHVPMPDMHALDYGLVWRGESENDMISAFAQVVRDLGPLDS